jgi:prophage regulatory protein
MDIKAGAKALTLLRINQVKATTGLSTATLYRLISARKFPRPIKIGQCAVAWVSSEVADWVRERIADRDRATREDNSVLLTSIRPGHECGLDGRR